MTDKTQLTKDDLTKICSACLRASSLMLEVGGRNSLVRECAKRMAEGMGADFIGFRAGYASLTLTLASGDIMLTRMGNVGHLGVNHRIDQEIRTLVSKVEKGGISAKSVLDELDTIAAQTPRHSPVVVSCAVGIACACFGRLLNIDWPAFVPVLLSSGIAQYLRMNLMRRHVNMFIVAAVIAFFSAFFSGLGAQLLGSHTVQLAMMAGILLLVPGIPATNAQADIMDGYPTMGSARAVSVLMVMIFVTVGAWIAQSLLGVRV